MTWSEAKYVEPKIVTFRVAESRWWFPGQEAANGQMWSKGAKVRLCQRSEVWRPNAQRGHVGRGTECDRYLKVHGEGASEAGHWPQGLAILGGFICSGDCKLVALGRVFWTPQ